MEKHELQEVYRNIKRSKMKKKSKTSLIEPNKPKSSGCKTCGKGTWKPY